MTDMRVPGYNNSYQIDSYDGVISTSEQSRYATAINRILGSPEFVAVSQENPLPPDMLAKLSDGKLEALTAEEHKILLQVLQEIGDFSDKNIQDFALEILWANEVDLSAVNSAAPDKVGGEIKKAVDKLLKNNIELETETLETVRNSPAILPDAFLKAPVSYIKQLLYKSMLEQLEKELEPLKLLEEIFQTNLQNIEEIAVEISNITTMKSVLTRDMESDFVSCEFLTILLELTKDRNTFTLETREVLEEAVKYLDKHPEQKINIIDRKNIPEELRQAMDIIYVYIVRLSYGIATDENNTDKKYLAFRDFVLRNSVYKIPGFKSEGRNLPVEISKDFYGWVIDYPLLTTLLVTKDSVKTKDIWNDLLSVFSGLQNKTKLLWQAFAAEYSEEYALYFAGKDNETKLRALIYFVRNAYLDKNEYVFFDHCIDEYDSLPVLLLKIYLNEYVAKKYPDPKGNDLIDIFTLYYSTEGEILPADIWQESDTIAAQKTILAARAIKELTMDTGLMATNAGIMQIFLQNDGTPDLQKGYRLFDEQTFNALVDNLSAEQLYPFTSKEELITFYKEIIEIRANTKSLNEDVMKFIIQNDNSDAKELYRILSVNSLEVVLKLEEQVVLDKIGNNLELKNFYIELRTLFLKTVNAQKKADNLRDSLAYSTNTDVEYAKKYFVLQDILISNAEEYQNNLYTTPKDFNRIITERQHKGTLPEYYTLYFRTGVEELCRFYEEIYEVHKAWAEVEAANIEMSDYIIKHSISKYHVFRDTMLNATVPEEPADIYISQDEYINLYNLMKNSLASSPEKYSEEDILLYVETILQNHEPWNKPLFKFVPGKGYLCGFDFNPNLNLDENLKFNLTRLEKTIKEIEVVYDIDLKDFHDGLKEKYEIIIAYEQKIQDFMFNAERALNDYLRNVYVVASPELMFELVTGTHKGNDYPAFCEALIAIAELDRARTLDVGNQPITVTHAKTTKKGYKRFYADIYEYQSRGLSGVIAQTADDIYQGFLQRPSSERDSYAEARDNFNRTITRQRLGEKVKTSFDEQTALIVFFIILLAHLGIKIGTKTAFGGSDFITWWRGRNDGPRGGGDGSPDISVEPTNNGSRRSGVIPRAFLESTRIGDLYLGAFSRGEAAEIAKAVMRAVYGDETDIQKIYVAEDRRLLRALADTLKVTPDAVAESIKKSIEQTRQIKDSYDGASSKVRFGFNVASLPRVGSFFRPIHISDSKDPPSFIRRHPWLIGMPLRIAAWHVPGLTDTSRQTIGSALNLILTRHNLPNWSYGHELAFDVDESGNFVPRIKTTIGENGYFDVQAFLGGIKNKYPEIYGEMKYFTSLEQIDDYIREKIATISNIFRDLPEYEMLQEYHKSRELGEIFKGYLNADKVHFRQEGDSTFVIFGEQKIMLQGVEIQNSALATTFVGEAETMDPAPTRLTLYLHNDFVEAITNGEYQKAEEILNKALKDVERSLYKGTLQADTNTFTPTARFDAQKFRTEIFTEYPAFYEDRNHKEVLGRINTAEELLTFLETTDDICLKYIIEQTGEYTNAIESVRQKNYVDAIEIYLSQDSRFEKKDGYWFDQNGVKISTISIDAQEAGTVCQVTEDRIGELQFGVLHFGRKFINAANITETAARNTAIQELISNNEQTSSEYRFLDLHKAFSDHYTGEKLISAYNKAERVITILSGVDSNWDAICSGFFYGNKETAIDFFKDLVERIDDTNPLNPDDLYNYIVKANEALYNAKAPTPDLNFILTARKFNLLNLRITKEGLEFTFKDQTCTVIISEDGTISGVLEELAEVHDALQNTYIKEYLSKNVQKDIGNALDLSGDATIALGILSDNYIEYLKKNSPFAATNEKIQRYEMDLLKLNNVALLNRMNAVRENFWENPPDPDSQQDQNRIAEAIAVLREMWLRADLDPNWASEESAPDYNSRFQKNYLPTEDVIAKFENGEMTLDEYIMNIVKTGVSYTDVVKGFRFNSQQTLAMLAGNDYKILQALCGEGKTIIIKMTQVIQAWSRRLALNATSDSDLAREAVDLITKNMDKFFKYVTPGLNYGYFDFSDPSTHQILENAWNSSKYRYTLIDATFNSMAFQIIADLKNLVEGKTTMFELERLFVSLDEIDVLMAKRALTPYILQLNNASPGLGDLFKSILNRFTNTNNQHSKIQEIFCTRIEKWVSDIINEARENHGQLTSWGIRIASENGKEMVDVDINTWRKFMAKNLPELIEQSGLYKDVLAVYNRQCLKKGRPQMTVLDFNLHVLTQISDTFAMLPKELHNDHIVNGNKLILLSGAEQSEGSRLVGEYFGVDFYGGPHGALEARYLREGLLSNAKEAFLVSSSEQESIRVVDLIKTVLYFAKLMGGSGTAWDARFAFLNQDILVFPIDRVNPEKLNLNFYAFSTRADKKQFLMELYRNKNTDSRLKDHPLGIYMEKATDCIDFRKELILDLVKDLENAITDYYAKQNLEIPQDIYRIVSEIINMAILNEGVDLDSILFPNIPLETAYYPNARLFEALRSNFVVPPEIKILLEQFIDKAEKIFIYNAETKDFARLIKLFALPDAIIIINDKGGRGTDYGAAYNNALRRFMDKISSQEFLKEGKSVVQAVEELLAKNAEGLKNLNGSLQEKKISEAEHAAKLAFSQAERDGLELLREYLKQEGLWTYDQLTEEVIRNEFTEETHPSVFKKKSFNLIISEPPSGGLIDFEQLKKRVDRFGAGGHVFYLCSMEDEIWETANGIGMDPRVLMSIRASNQGRFEARVKGANLQTALGFDVNSEEFQEDWERMKIIFGEPVGEYNPNADYIFANDFVTKIDKLNLPSEQTMSLRDLWYKTPLGSIYLMTQILGKHKDQLNLKQVSSSPLDNEIFDINIVINGAALQFGNPRLIELGLQNIRELWIKQVYKIAERLRDNNDETAALEYLNKHLKEIGLAELTTFPANLQELINNINSEWLVKNSGHILALEEAPGSRYLDAYRGNLKGYKDAIDALTKIYKNALTRLEQQYIYSVPDDEQQKEKDLRKKEMEDAFEQKLSEILTSLYRDIENAVNIELPKTNKTTNEYLFRFDPALLNKRNAQGEPEFVIPDAGVVTVRMIQETNRTVGFVFVLRKNDGSIREFTTQEELLREYTENNLATAATIASDRFVPYLPAKQINRIIAKAGLGKEIPIVLIFDKSNNIIGAVEAVNTVDLSGVNRAFSPDDLEKIQKQIILQQAKIPNIPLSGAVFDHAVILNNVRADIIAYIKTEYGDETADAFAKRLPVDIRKIQAIFAGSSCAWFEAYEEAAVKEAKKKSLGTNWRVAHLHPDGSDPSQEDLDREVDVIIPLGNGRFRHVQIKTNYDADEERVAARANEEQWRMMTKTENGITDRLGNLFRDEQTGKLFDFHITHPNEDNSLIQETTPIQEDTPFVGPGGADPETPPPLYVPGAVTDIHATDRLPAAAQNNVIQNGSNMSDNSQASNPARSLELTDETNSPDRQFMQKIQETSRNYAERNNMQMQEQQVQQQRAPELVNVGTAEENTPTFADLLDRPFTAESLPIEHDNTDVGPEDFLRQIEEAKKLEIQQIQLQNGNVYEYEYVETPDSIIPPPRYPSLFGPEARFTIEPEPRIEMPDGTIPPIGINPPRPEVQYNEIITPPLLVSPILNGVENFSQPETVRPLLEWSNSSNNLPQMAAASRINPVYEAMPQNVKNITDLFDFLGKTDATFKNALHSDQRWVAVEQEFGRLLVDNKSKLGFNENYTGMSDLLGATDKNMPEIRARFKELYEKGFRPLLQEYMLRYGLNDASSKIMEITFNTLPVAAIGLVMATVTEIVRKDHYDFDLNERAASITILAQENISSGSLLIYTNTMANVLVTNAITWLNNFSASIRHTVSTDVSTTVLPKNITSSVRRVPTVTNVSTDVAVRNYVQNWLAAAPGLFALGAATEGVVNTMKRYGHLLASGDAYDLEMFNAALFYTCLAQGTAFTTFAIPQIILQKMLPSLSTAMLGRIVAMAGGILMTMGINVGLQSVANLKIEDIFEEIKKTRDANRAAGIPDPPRRSEAETLSHISFLNKWTNAVEDLKKAAGTAFVLNLPNLAIRLAVGGGKTMALSVGSVASLIAIVSKINAIALTIEAGILILHLDDDINHPDPNKMPLYAYALDGDYRAVSTILDQNGAEGVARTPFQVAQILQRDGCFDEVRNTLRNMIPANTYISSHDVGTVRIDNLADFDRLWDNLMKALRTDDITKARPDYNNWLVVQEAVWLIGELYNRISWGQDYGDGHIADAIEATQSENKFFEFIMTEAWTHFYNKHKEYFRGSTEFMTEAFSMTDKDRWQIGDEFTAGLRAVLSNEQDVRYRNSRQNYFINNLYNCLARRTRYGNLDFYQPVNNLEQQKAYYRTQGIEIDGNWNLRTVRLPRNIYGSAPNFNELLKQDNIFDTNKRLFVDVMQWLICETENINEYITLAPIGISLAYYEAEIVLNELRTRTRRIIERLNNNEISLEEVVRFFTRVINGQEIINHPTQKIRQQGSRELMPMPIRYRLSLYNASRGVDTANTMLTGFFSCRLAQARDAVQSPFGSFDNIARVNSASGWRFSDIDPQIREEMLKALSLLNNDLVVINEITLLSGSNDVADRAKAQRIYLLRDTWQNVSQATRNTMREYLRGQIGFTAKVMGINGRIDRSDLTNGRVILGAKGVQLLSQRNNLTSTMVRRIVSPHQDGKSAIDYFVSILAANPTLTEENRNNALQQFIWVNKLTTSDEVLTEGQIVFVPLAVGADAYHFGGSTPIIAEQIIIEACKVQGINRLNEDTSASVAAYLNSTESTTEDLLSDCILNSSQVRASIRLFAADSGIPATYEAVVYKMKAENLIEQNASVQDVMNVLLEYQNFQVDSEVKDILGGLGYSVVGIGKYKVFCATVNLIRSINTACGTQMVGINNKQKIININDFLKMIKSIYDDSSLINKKLGLTRKILNTITGQAEMENDLLIYELASSFLPEFNTGNNLAESMFYLLDVLAGKADGARNGNLQIPTRFSQLPADSIYGAARLDVFLICNEVLTIADIPNLQRNRLIVYEQKIDQNIKNQTPEEQQLFIANFYTLYFCDPKYYGRIEEIVLNSPILLKAIYKSEYKHWLREIINSRLMSEPEHYRQLLTNVIADFEKNLDSKDCAEFIQANLSAYLNNKSGAITYRRPIKGFTPEKIKDRLVHPIKTVSMYDDTGDLMGINIPANTQLTLLSSRPYTFTRGERKSTGPWYPVEYKMDYNGLELTIQGYVLDENENVLFPENVSTRYTVRRGDTLSEIAAAHGLTLTDFYELNPEVDPRKGFNVLQLDIGRVLRVK
jgi:exonuclease VII small subunit